MENNIIMFGEAKKNDILTMTFFPKYVIHDSTSTIKEVNTTTTSLCDSAENLLKHLFEECWNKYENIFIQTILNEYIEDGYFSNSQILFNNIVKEYNNIISSQFLNEIYLKNATSNKVIKSLLYIMANMQLNDLHGIELGIVMFAFSHKDYEIKDLALQCFEKWKEPRYIGLLSTQSMGVDYLDEYLKYIISKTEEKRLTKCI